MIPSVPDDEHARVVLKYYLYRAVGGPGFIYPIYVLYLLSHDLSYAQIGTIGAVQSVVVILGEMPTGYVGDRIGRRNSLLVAQLVFAASAVGMILGDGFLDLTLSFAVLSLGMTFVSGSGDAWLYDALAEHLDEDRFTHVRGRGSAIGQWVTALTMIAGGLLYVAGHVYPFVALLVVRLVTAGVVLTMPKNAQYADDPERRGAGPADGDDEPGPTAGADLTVLEALPIIRDRLLSPGLRSFVAYVAMFLGVTVTVDVFVQPIAVDGLRTNAGSLLTALGLAEPAVLGALYAAFTVTSAVASDYASDLEAALGVRTAMLAVPLATGLLAVLPAVVPLLAFPMFFGVRAAQSVLRPISGQYVNDRVESVGRATVLSAVSMVYALVRIPFAISAGLVADAHSPLVAVAVAGAAFVVAGGALFVVSPPVRREAGTGAVDAATSD